MSMPSDFERVLKTMRTPEKSFAFFGSNPSWTPDREKNTKAPVPGSQAGRTEIPDSCKVCGGLQAEGSNDDPLYSSSIHVTVCASCMRTPIRHRGSEKGSVFAADPKRLGRLVAKACRKEDKAVAAKIKKGALA